MSFERPVAPATHMTPADPSNPRVQQALAFNHLTSVPGNWVMDSSGQLRLKDIEGTPGPLIPIDEPTKASFLSELAHALPYVAGAELMGVAGAFLGGATNAAEATTAAATGAGAGPSTAANIAATTAASSAVPASLAAPATAAAGVGAGAEAFDAAGNFIGPSTVSGGGGGILDTAGSFLSGGKGLPGYLDTAGKIANALGAAGKGLADARTTEATYQQRQDQLNQTRYGNDLAGARLNLSAPSERAHASVQGDILANAKPFTWTGGTHQVGNIPVPEYSGGLNPGIFSANTRALGGEMSANALKDNSRLPLGNAIGPAPGLTPLPQAGAMDSILNTAGTLGNFADVLNQYKRKPVDPNDPNAGGVS